MITTQTLKNKRFIVKEHGAFVLVHPSRGKWDWQAGELRFRSVVLDHGGRVVSTGWPKFFNQRGWPEYGAVIAGELAAGTAVITHNHSQAQAGHTDREGWRTRGPIIRIDHGDRVPAWAARPST